MFSNDKCVLEQKRSSYRAVARKYRLDVVVGTVRLAGCFSRQLLGAKREPHCSLQASATLTGHPLFSPFLNGFAPILFSVSNPYQH